MEFLQQPAPMAFDGDLGSNWKKIKSNMELYMAASGCNQKGDKMCGTVALYGR